MPLATMFLLNPPRKSKKKMLGLKYPGSMGSPAKKKARPSHTHGGKRISALLRRELGLKEGETPIRHRVTFYRGKKRKLLVRSPYAVLRNKKRRKEVNSNMARRKHKRAKRAVAHRRRRRHNPVIANRRRRRIGRRAGRRVSRIAAIILKNKRRHYKRARRNLVLSNPTTKSIVSVVGKAAGLFGGYAVTRVATNYLWGFIEGKVITPTTTMSAKTQDAIKKWAPPAVNLGVTLGLSYVAKQFIFKKKPEIANYILLGGLFSVIKTVVDNVAPEKVKAKLAGYVPEYSVNAYQRYVPISDYVPETPTGIEEEVEELEPDRYAELY